MSPRETLARVSRDPREGVASRADAPSKRQASGVASATPEPTLFDADVVLDNSDSWWKDCAERALLWWSDAGVEFTADDVVDLGVPEPDHPNRLGALFMAASKRGQIEAVGYRPSTKPSRHGGIVRIWRGRRAA